MGCVFLKCSEQKCKIAKNQHSLYMGGGDSILSFYILF